MSLHKKDSIVSGYSNRDISNFDWCRQAVIQSCDNHIFLDTRLPHYRKLMLHEIKVLEINSNLVENDFQIKEITAKERVTNFKIKEINATFTKK